MAVSAEPFTNNLFDLSGRVSVVTGGAQGMGLAMAKALVTQGSSVLLVDLNADGLKNAASEIKEIGGKVETLVQNVTDDDAPARIIAAAGKLGGGKIDVLVNNAGILSNSDFPDMTDADYDRVMSINLRAPMRIMRAVGDVMLEQGNGSIINIGSSWSTRGSVFNQDGGGPDYCASKAAIQSLTRSAAHDYASRNVRVNAIAPGAVDTGMHAHHREFLMEYEKFIPLGRMQLAHDIAGTAVFLASNASAYLTGQTIHVNGGMIMVD